MYYTENDLPTWAKYWSEARRKEVLAEMNKLQCDECGPVTEDVTVTISDIEKEIDELSKSGFTGKQIAEIEAYRGMGHTLDSAMQKVLAKEI